MSTATDYAKALFSLSEELGTTEAVRGDLHTADAAMRQNPEYIKLLDSPAVPAEEKLALIGEAFREVDGSLRNLMCILCEKHAMHLFSSLARAYDALFDEARGILRATAVTAVAMTDGQIAALCEKLSALTGKTAILTNTVDPSVLGGVRLRYAGIQRDGSLKARLDGVEAKLKSAIL